MSTQDYKHKIQIKVRPDQWEALQEKAVEAGYVSKRSGRPKIATYIYDRIIKYDDVIYRLEGIPHLMDWYRMQAKVDNNINQLARTVNRMNALKRREEGEDAYPYISEARMEDLIEFLAEHDDIRKRHNELLELILQELKELREKHAIQL